MNTRARKALPLLQIMSSGVPFGRVDKREVDRQRDRITELEDELEKLRSGDALDEKIQKAVQLALQTNRREQWEELKQTQA